VRLEADAAIVEFAVEALDVGLEKRTFDLDWEVANANVEQLFVAETLPGKSITHETRTLFLGGDIGANFLGLENSDRE